MSETEKQARLVQKLKMKGGEQTDICKNHDAIGHDRPDTSKLSPYPCNNPKIFDSK